MALTVRAQVVDIRADTPKDTDVFLVDTNAWYWLFYSRASLTQNGPLARQLNDYPTYLGAAISAKASLHCYGLTFAELAHNIEKAEREIYEAQTVNSVSPKTFRHDYPNQRRKAVAHIAEAWADVLSVSTMLDLDMNSAFLQSALTLFPSAGLDGYDLFMAEAALKAGVTQIVTDDGDYATVPGLKIFTSNHKVIQAAHVAGKLLSR